MWVINPSLASILDGLQVDFPFFRLAVTGKKEKEESGMLQEKMFHHFLKTNKLQFY